MTRRIAWLLGTFVVIAAIGPWFAPYHPEEQYRDFMFAPPMRPRVIANGMLRTPFVYSVAMADRLDQRYDVDTTRQLPLPWFGDDHTTPVFLLGADSYGRDLLSRLLYGARLSLTLAMVSVLGALLIGTTIGATAGYRGGWIDEIAMRAVDFVLVLPVIYVALVLRATMPLSLSASAVFIMMAAIFVLVGWPFVARGVRGIVAAERNKQYVVAAQALGASDIRIISRHLLPACTGFLLVQSTILLPAFILGEATLSYVGLGFPEHVATWGTMVSEASTVNAMSRFPWTLVSAAAIFLVVFSANAVLQSDKIDATKQARRAGL